MSSSPVKEHTHREIMVILGGLMTGLLLAALDQTIVSTALKSIVEDFNGLNHYTGCYCLPFDINSIYPAVRKNF